MPKVLRSKEQEKKVKERKQRSKYGQARLKPARNGVHSCTVAGGITLLLLILFMITYASNGQAAAIIGAIGLVAAAAAVFGLVLGIKGFKERDKNYLTCKIGAGINGLLVVLFIIIFIRGLI